MAGFAHRHRCRVWQTGRRDEAQHDLLALASFRQRYWRQIWSANPLECFKKKIKLDTDVFGVFPNPVALLAWQARSW